MLTRPPRIAITGLGIVSPLGLDVATYWRALLAGESGVSFITDFRPTSYAATSQRRSRVSTRRSGSITKEQDIYGRVEQFAGRRCGRSDRPGGSRAVSIKTRVGVLVSTGQGAVEIFEEQIRRSTERGPRAVSPYFIPGVMLNAVSALVSVKHRFMGPSFNIASACATAQPLAWRSRR